MSMINETYLLYLSGRQMFMHLNAYNEIKRWDWLQIAYDEVGK